MNSKPSLSINVFNTICPNYCLAIIIYQNTSAITAIMSDIQQKWEKQNVQHVVT